MSCRGFEDLGRTRFLTTARVIIASVSSGSSLYSAGLMRCTSTRAKSDFDVRRATGLLTLGRVVGDAHAVSVLTTACGSRNKAAAGVTLRGNASCEAQPSS